MVAMFYLFVTPLTPPNRPGWGGRGYIPRWRLNLVNEADSPKPPAGKSPEASAAEMMELVLPNDANLLGNCLGGRVMYLIDIAGFLAASRHCGRTVVTASMDSLDFREPIRVGEAVVVQARVNYAGRTSVEVEVRVLAENLAAGRRRPTCTAYVTYVALDGEGRPAPVPPVIPSTDADRERYRAAGERRRERLRRLGRLE